MAQRAATLPTEEKRIKVDWLKVLGAIGTFAAFFIVQSLNLPEVSPEGQGALAILAAGIVVWITQPIPMAHSSLILMVLAWVLGYVPMETALSSFADSTFWLLIAACGLGACIAASGLAKRIALTILSAIGEPTYKRVLAAAFVTTFALSFLIPSVLAKSIAILAVFTPLVPQFGVNLKSNIGKGITLSILLLGYVGNGVLPTAGIIAVLVYGGLTQAGYEVNFARWALIGVPAVVLIFVATYFFMLRFARPEVEAVPAGREGIREQLKALPPMSLQEGWTLAITLLILINWIFDPLNLGSAAVGLLGVMLLLMPMVGSMNISEFMQKGIPWEIVILVGAIIGVSAIVPATGVAPVIGKLMLPVLSLAKSSVGVALSALILNLIQWPLMIIVPTIPLVIGPLVEAGAAIGMSPEGVAVFYLMFFPQFYFWAFATFTALAFKDEAADLKDWLIASAAVFVITVVVLFLIAAVWVPIVS
jgi:anion transporter